MMHYISLVPFFCDFIIKKNMHFSFPFNIRFFWCVAILISSISAWRHLISSVLFLLPHLYLLPVLLHGILLARNIAMCAVLVAYKYLNVKRKTLKWASINKNSNIRINRAPHSVINHISCFLLVP